MEKRDKQRQRVFNFQYQQVRQQWQLGFPMSDISLIKLSLIKTLEDWKKNRLVFYKRVLKDSWPEWLMLIITIKVQFIKDKIISLYKTFILLTPNFLLKDFSKLFLISQFLCLFYILIVSYSHNLTIPLYGFNTYIDTYKVVQTMLMLIMPI